MFKWVSTGQQITVPIDNESGLATSVQSLFTSKMLLYGKPIYRTARTLENCPIEDLNLEGIGIDARLMHEESYHERQDYNKTYGWEEGIAFFEIRYEKDEDGNFDNRPVPAAHKVDKHINDDKFICRIYFIVHSTSESDVQKILKKFEKWEYLPVESNRGRIYTLVNTNGGLSSQSIGKAKLPLIEENYDENVISDVKYIIENLQKSNPAGRITILNGKPGVGKTHLIRSIIDSVDVATFLLLPPELVGSLTGPELMSFFVQNNAQLAKPVVLVIEDADSCLTGRSMDNMSLISSLLNISDGIIGNLMDIRIIATTNVEIKDIDPAILRPGRLLKRVNIDTLSQHKASEIYKRLTKKEKMMVRPMTLAEIYYEARETDENIDGASIQKKIGFDS